MMARSHTFSALLLLALLPLGCSGDKEKPAAPKANKTDKAPEVAKAATKVTPSPTPVQPLPKDEGEHVGALKFAISHGSPGTDGARGFGIDPEGNYLVSGYFKGPGIFGSDYSTEDMNAFLAKLSGKDGSVIWSKALGGPGADIADALAVGHDGSSVVVGTMAGEFHVGDGTLTSEGADDVFIAKFAADGRRLWVKRIGDKDIDGGHAAVLDSKGNAYVTGVFRGPVVFGEVEIASKGRGDIFLCKLSPTGEFLWTKTFGNREEDYGRDLALDSEGNVVLLAEISYEGDFGGGPLTTNGNRDLALVKLTADGDHLWSKSMGNNYDDLGISLAIDSSDNILFTGSFEDTLNLGGEDLVAVGRSDLYVAKYNKNGEHSWSISFGGKDKDWGNSIDCDSFGNCYVTGWFWYEVDFGGTKLKSKGEDDAFLAKLSPTGSVLWAKSFGGSSRDKGKAVAVDAKGGVVTTGSYNIEIDLGAGKLTPASEEGSMNLRSDFYIAAFER